VHGRPYSVPSAPPIDALLTSAGSTHPHDPALAFADATLTYGELDQTVGRLAGELGVSPGERVAIVAPNVPALVVAMFAAWRAGAVAMPLSARLRHFELERAFADASPSAAVSVARHAGFSVADQVAALMHSAPALRRAIVVDELGEVTDTTSTAGADDRPEPSPGPLAAILYTSGTTGEPKGGLLSHLLARVTARNLAELLGEHAGAPYGLVVPASHAFGLGCMLAGIAAGANAVLVDATTSLEPLIEALREHDARVLHGSPALFARLLRAGAELRLSTGLVAGSLCPPDALESLDARGTRILNVYGMTEISAASGCRLDDSPQTRYHTVGQPLPGYQVRAADGEIQIRSDYFLGGYYGRPWGEHELTQDGWFRTGDLGTIDPDGNLMIQGRAKEVVHVGGFNVFPAEVESFLLTHPKVAQAAVIGAPHPVLGEAVQAFIVPAGEQQLEPREIVRYARAGIAGYKVPYVVEIVEQLPLLPSGKPDRRALSSRVQAAEVAP
jgi:acyl-CoA synthetase (AMP-forming)/AMP-acid ligase II